jgi:hypothetical protein
LDPGRSLRRVSGPPLLSRAARERLKLRGAHVPSSQSSKCRSTTALAMAEREDSIAPGCHARAKRIVNFAASLTMFRGRARLHLQCTYGARSTKRITHKCRNLWWKGRDSNISPKRLKRRVFSDVALISCPKSCPPTERSPLRPITPAAAKGGSAP